MMKPILVSRRSEADAGSARIVMLVLVSFLLGVAVTVFWFHHAANKAGAAASETVSQPPAPAQEQVGVPAPPAAPAPVSPAANPQPTDPAIIEEVKKAVPNFASISLQDGEQILRACALKQFADTTAETDDEIKRAQQQLQDARNSGSAVDQQAAMKHVQDTQAAAAEKLKQIAANLQAQLAALKSMKNQQ